MDTSHENLEDRAAVFISGGIADRPAVPSAETDRMFFLATDQNAPVGILYYSDGTDWQTLNSFGAPVSESPGDTQAQGSASTLARSDHRHAMLPWGASGEIAATSTSNSAGSTAKYARIDHVHQIGNNSVTAGKIAAGGVSAANQLANNVVSTSAIQNGAVTQAKLDPNALIPAGTILPWAGQSSTPPTGWLLCDGSAISKTEYSNLYSVIGDNYNLAYANSNPNLTDDRNGNISGTMASSEGLAPPNDKFRIPDLRSRFPLGNSSMNNSQIGSANERMITTDTNTVQRSRNAAFYEHSQNGTTNGAGTIQGWSYPSSNYANAQEFQQIRNFRTRRYTDAVQSNDTAIQFAPYGTGYVLPSMPPFVTLQYIIKF
jgi:microcystin-dependent protein